MTARRKTALLGHHAFFRHAIILFKQGSIVAKWIHKSIDCDQLKTIDNRRKYLAKIVSVLIVHIILVLCYLLIRNFVFKNYNFKSYEQKGELVHFTWINNGVVKDIFLSRDWLIIVREVC